MNECECVSGMCVSNDRDPSPLVHRRALCTHNACLHLLLRARANTARHGSKSHAIIFTTVRCAAMNKNDVVLCFVCKLCCVTTMLDGRQRCVSAVRTYEFVASH